MQEEVEGSTSENNVFIGKKNQNLMETSVNTIINSEEKMRSVYGNEENEILNLNQEVINMHNRPRGSFEINGNSEDKSNNEVNLENKQKGNLIKESGQDCDCLECIELREREALFGQEEEGVEREEEEIESQDPFGLYPILERGGEELRKKRKGKKKSKSTKKKIKANSEGEKKKDKSLQKHEDKSEDEGFKGSDLEKGRRQARGAFELGKAIGIWCSDQEYEEGEIMERFEIIKRGIEDDKKDS